MFSLTRSIIKLTQIIKKSSKKRILLINRSKHTDIFIRKDWVSASKTRNFSLDNTLIDWLEYWYNESSEKKHFKNHTGYTGKNRYYNNLIMNNGIHFEYYIISQLKQKVSSTEFVTICANMNNYDKRVIEYEQHTIQEIMKGTPIIYQALLMNRKGILSNSYGIPDLLIRSDYINKIIQTDPIENKMTTLRAPKLNGNYHYVVIDIKCTTLKLFNDCKHIKNYGNVPAYKCQLYIYNHALGNIQGYEPPSSFVLAKNYKSKNKVDLLVGQNYFYRLGNIEYIKHDREYINKTIAAVNWIKLLRSSGEKWKLLPKPSVPELYPNMISAKKTSWYEFKSEYVNKIL